MTGPPLQGMGFAKLRRILNSDLTGVDRLRYAVDEALAKLGLERSGVRQYGLQCGAEVLLRSRSTDRKVFDEVFLERIYEPLAQAIVRESSPGVLVDLGANIGLSALFLDRMLGFDYVIAVEPDYENLRMLRANLEPNLSVEVTSIQAFAGGERGFANLLDEGYGAWGLRMGDEAESGIPVVPLQEIIPNIVGGVLLKCDIEGAERFVFPHIAEWDDRVRFIILELHTEFFSEAQLRDALASSRYEWYTHGSIAPGAVCAVFALERGALKAEPLQSGSDSRSHSRGAAAV